MLKIYKEDFTVRSYQTDLNARMKPSAILEVMQEAAGQHSERLGLGRSALLAKNTAWVLTRVEVDMDRYPAFEETFSVETFPMPVRRCFFPRYFIFRDSNGIEIGRAATLWVLLDLGTRSMTKLDVVKALMREFGKEVPVDISGMYRLGDIRHNFADLSKMKKLLGFEPRKTFAQGIAEFTEWVLNQPVQESNFERSMQELKSKGFLKS